MSSPQPTPSLFPDGELAATAPPPTRRPAEWRPPAPDWQLEREEAEQREREARERAARDKADAEHERKLRLELDAADQPQTLPAPKRRRWPR